MWLESASWVENGKYHSATLNKKLFSLLEPYFFVPIKFLTLLNKKRTPKRPFSKSNFRQLPRA